MHSVRISGSDARGSLSMRCHKSTRVASSTMAVFSEGRSIGPGRCTPGPTILRHTIWTAPKGSQPTLTRKSKDDLVIVRQHFVFLRYRLHTGNRSASPISV